MKARMAWFGFPALFLLATFYTPAQNRWEVTPFVGWESSGSYPINSATSTIDRLRINSSLSFGGFFDYSLTENFQPEFFWARNNTSYSAHDFVTNQYFNAYHTDNDQFQFGMIYMFRSSEVKLRPYFGVGVGFTHEENSNGNPNRTEFAWNVGGGVKYHASKHVGFRGDVRYLPTRGSTTVGTYCDPFFGCYLANVHNYLHRANLVGGVVFSF